MCNIKHEPVRELVSHVFKWIDPSNVITYLNCI
jgi:hypothetical protein